MTRNTIGLLEIALEIISIVCDRMTQNPIGLLELALEISTAKTNGCDQGDCSCGEGDDCLATGWENFVPQPKQPAQTKQPKNIL